MEPDEKVFGYSLLSLILSALLIFITNQLVIIPYGKHYRAGWGPTLSPPIVWFLMESPTIWLTLLLFPFGQHSSNPKALALISPFLLHYLHRTFIYPLRLSPPRKTASGFPVTVALMGFSFNLLNSYVQARWVSHYAHYETDGWFWWRFSSGMAVFLGGMAVNVWSDMVLVGLKSEGGRYKIPKGGWFEVVSCPNYLGEILEWLGWAFMTWSWAGFGFFLATIANLMPRAREHHKWYLDKFGEDYPKTRKYVIPILY